MAVFFTTPIVMPRGVRLEVEFASFSGVTEFDARFSPQQECRIVFVNGRTRTVAALAILLLGSCGKSDPNRKPTIPVRGVVQVNGQPAGSVSITWHDSKGMDKAQPTFTSAISKPDGHFAASTYEEGDGAPVGDYTMTFTLGKFNSIAMQYEGDEFKGKYNDPVKSEFKVKVETGKPVDLGKIELTTK